MSKKTSDVLTGGNMCMGNSAPVLGTGANTLATSAVVISLNGRAYAVGAAAAAALPTTDAATGKAFVALGKNKACVFVVGVDKAGTRYVYQGPQSSESGFASGADALEFPPNIPENVCPIAYFVARSTDAAAGTWLPSNNMTGVTGVTTAAQAVTWLPSAPMFITN